MRLVTVGALVALALPLSAQEPGTKPARIPASFDFSIANIMRGPELYGRAPANVRWSADSRWIVFSWNEPGTDWREPLHTYRRGAAAGSRLERLSIAQADSVEPFVADGPRSPDGRARVVEANGDLYVVSTQGTPRRLTQTREAESNPTWSRDGGTVYFVRDSNAYSIRLADGFTRQLTDIRGGPAPKDSAKATGQRGRLEAQQRDLFESVRDRLAADSVARAERKAREALGLQPIYLNAGERVQSIDVSPDGRAALAVVGQRSTATRQAEIPQFVTASGYVENLRGRTKVGDALSRQRVLWISLSSSKATPLSVFGADSVSGFVSVAGWSDDGARAAFYAFPSDHKSRVLYTVPSDSARLTTIETLRDTAWVGGPCASCAGFVEHGSRLWFVSEATGFAQLYSASPAGGEVKPLTSGSWEVLDVSVSPDGRTFYLTTNEPSPAEQQLYRMPVTGGVRTRITSESGSHSAVVSPDGGTIADVHSFVNEPPDLFLAPNRPGTTLARLTTSPSAEFLSVSWLAPALVKVPASDGIAVPGHLYRPQDMGAAPNGAAVIFVHGAGYLHNVGNFWSEYPREYLFNQYLAQHGYVVLDLDYRASAGYGRDWRTAIYRWMGGRDLQDEVDGSKWLTQQFGIPASRIGLYGGSYGGFMTLMALFTAQDRFGAGAALRSVTDWAHYNEGYTSAILNRPQDDTVAYRRSSPIYFASGLRAPLLMAHGMVDQNVHYEDIVRLEQRLIELGKKDWSLASYPVEDHGFVRPSSWTDEYTRIFDLFERTIRKAPGDATPR
jgi:dipeptidyl aminopeptidase/acylaminoacyl peptidase